MKSSARIEDPVGKTANAVRVQDGALVVHSRRIPLNDYAEIRRFVDEEAEFWLWLNKAENPYYDRLLIVKRLSDLIGEIAYGDEPVSVDWAERLASLYQPGGLPLSSSPTAQFIKGLSEKNPTVAKYALQYFSGGLQRVESPSAIEAVTVSVLFQHGIRGNTRAERAALQRLRDQWESGFDEINADYRNLRVDLEKQNQEVADRVEGLEKHAADFLKELQTEIIDHQSLRETIEQKHVDEINKYVERGTESLERMQESISGTREELERLTAAYNQHMALKAPVQYLTENSDTHRASARGYLRLLWGTAPVALLLLGATGWFLLASRDKPPIGNMILFFMFAGLIVWFLRILARLYLSHKHLEVDARERVVAAKTYLALIAEGVEPRDAERTIIMGTLFRPAAIGIMDDDAVPTSSVDLVSRVLKGDK